MVCFPHILDILRDDFNYDLPSESRVLYIIPLINIYHSVSLEMMKLNIPYQVMLAGGGTTISRSTKVVFISPERLQNSAIMKSVMKLKWSCISIDEPHMALEWGISKSRKLKPFREAFAKLNSLNILGTVFEMHSATIENIEMLYQLVGRKNSSWSKQLVVPERPNLTYFLYHGKRAPESILQLPCVERRLEAEEPGIMLIYVQSISEGSEIYVSILNYCEENNLLKFPTKGSQVDFSVSFLHSSLTEKRKVEILEKAVANNIKILVATSAAGAGINIPVTSFIGWGLDRLPSGIIQAQGRTGRNPFNGEGIVIWAHNPKIHGRRLSATSKVRDLFQSECLRKTINSWFSHGLMSAEERKTPEMCCNLCMEDCLEKTGCLTCSDKLERFKPKVFLLDVSKVAESLAEFLKSLKLNQTTPSSTPKYSEESLAEEITKHLKEVEALNQLTAFLEIFSLSKEVNTKIYNFLKDFMMGFQATASQQDLNHPESVDDSDSSIDSDNISNVVSEVEYFDSESEEEV